MTNQKPSRESNQFKQPTIGPKVYLSVSSSGWTETFPRAKADKELANFLLPATIAQVVKMFVSKRLLAVYEDPTDKVITWFTITGFLGRTMNCSPLDVPIEAAIAFWAHAVIAFTEQAAS